MINCLKNKLAQVAAPVVAGLVAGVAAHAARADLVYVTVPAENAVYRYSAPNSGALLLPLLAQTLQQLPILTNPQSSATQFAAQIVAASGRLARALSSAKAGLASTYRLIHSVNQISISVRSLNDPILSRAIALR